MNRGVLRLYLAIGQVGLILAKRFLQVAALHVLKVNVFVGESRDLCVFDRLDFGLKQYVCLLKVC